MSRALRADPASLSAAGAIAARTAERLADVANDLDTTYAALGSGWSGPTARVTRAHGELVTEGLTALASELRRIGSLLQDHAADVAELVAQWRRLEESVADGGLHLRGGRVASPWGIRGEADAEDIAAQDLRRTELQAGLDALRARNDRLVDQLVHQLDESRKALSQVSTRVRLG